MHRDQALFLLLAVVLALYAQVSWAIPKIEAKCSACRSIGRELERRISEEKPRNALDMRHRLDSTGQRYGRVINYKNSELRATELLDKLCKDVKAHYALVTVNTSGEVTHHWAKVSGKDTDDLTNTTKLSGDEADAMNRKLDIYCGAVMEEHEEDLAQALMAEKIDGPGTAQYILCKELMHSCPHLKMPQPPAEQKEVAGGEKLAQQQGGAGAAAKAEGGEGEKKKGKKKKGKKSKKAAAEAAAGEAPAAGGEAKAEL